MADYPDECPRGMHLVDGLEAGERVYVLDGTVAALAEELLRMCPAHPRCFRCKLPMVLVNAAFDERAAPDLEMQCPGVCDHAGGPIPMP